MKINVLISIITVFICQLIAYADWQPQNSGTNENLYAAYFFDENTGWVVGFNGKILATTNGGTNWNSQTSGTSQTLFNVKFVSASNGFIIGSLNTFLKTTNGGANWTSMGVPNMTSTNDIGFVDNNTGYVCGADGDISKTTNGGTNWTKFDAGTNDFFVLYVINASTVLVGGVGGTIYKTSNGGTNWTQQITGTVNFISALVFPTATNGYFTTLGLSEDVRKTTNGGLNWTAVTSPGNTAGLNDLAAVNSSVIYGVGPSGKIRRTTNSGTNWETQPSGDTTTFLRGIFMFNADIGFVVGNGGRILKTNNGGIGIHQISSNVPEQFSLSQNYPNPFNPVTNFNFSIPKSGNVKLVIYDVNGKQVAELLNSFIRAGFYKADFDASNLSSGVYFYKLITNEFTEAKKMTLVK